MSVVSVPLTKGQRFDLSKAVPGLALVGVGLGWDVKRNPDAKHEFDVDAVAFGLRDGKLKSAADLLFYGLATASGKPFQIHNGALAHSGDNLTGAGDGDDETILVDLNHADFPKEVTEILIMVSIYDADNRGKQNFGQIENCSIRIYDAATNTEICKYDLTEDYDQFNAVIFGKLYLKDGSWRFQATGEGMNGTINDLAGKLS